MTARAHLQSDVEWTGESSLAYMLRLSAPMVVSTISFTIMQFVDRFMVSRLGTNALAAVSPVGFVSLLPGAFALGTTASLNTFVSQSLGRGQKTECARYFWQMTYMGLAYCLAVVAVMGPAAPWIFKMMGQPAPVAEMEVTIPAEFMGDVTGNLTGHRGRILGMDQVGPMQLVRAEIPMAEVTRYAAELKSMTGGESSTPTTKRPA